MTADLHCHSILSDGSMPVNDLVQYAAAIGLSHLAVTDHDTMEGVPTAVQAGHKYNVQVLSGCEISCIDPDTANKVHILCFLPKRPELLQAVIEPTIQSRNAAGKRMIATLLKNFPVTEQQIYRYTSQSGSIYKSHIIRPLLDMGYDSKCIGPLYKKLFGRDGICYEPVEYPNVYDVVKTARTAGAVAVMAHPSDFNGLGLMQKLAQAQLVDGLEVHHPRCSDENKIVIEQTADRYGLLKTGGTDFHGHLTSNPNPLGTCTTCDEWIRALIKFSDKI